MRVLGLLFSVFLPHTLCFSKAPCRYWGKGSVDWNASPVCASSTLYWKRQVSLSTAGCGPPTRVYYCRSWSYGNVVFILSSQCTNTIKTRKPWWCWIVFLGPHLFTETIMKVPSEQLWQLWQYRCGNWDFPRRFEVDCLKQLLSKRKL